MRFLVFSALMLGSALIPLSAQDLPKLALGQKPDDVRKLIGPPTRISRQVYQLRAQEQWHYGAPHHLRLVFDCPRGQKPTLQRIIPGADR